MQREFEILQELVHDNIVKYIDHSEQTDEIYIVTELCQSCTLLDYVKGHKIREQIDMFTVLEHVLLGVQYMHDKNVVHRDLKPKNILFTFPDCKGDIRAVICDLGLSKMVRGDQNVTMSQKYGTENFIAPEVKGNTNSDWVWFILFEEVNEINTHFT